MCAWREVVSHWLTFKGKQTYLRRLRFVLEKLTAILNTCPCSLRAKFPMLRSTLKEMWFQALETEIRKWDTLVLSLLYIHSKNGVLPISSAFLLFKPWARIIPTVLRNMKFKGEETSVVFGLGTQIWKSLCLYKTKEETFFHVSCVKHVT